MATAYRVPDFVATAIANGETPTRVFRMAARMSPSTFSKLTGIAEGRLEAIELGEPPLDSEIAIMARLLGIPAELFTGHVSGEIGPGFKKSH
jgi:hypothetical protein